MNIKLKRIVILFVAVFLTAFFLYRYDFFIVTSGSMKPTIDVGSVVVIDTNSIVQNNDIITFTMKDSIITHRLVDISNDEYITKGDANETIDPSYIKKDDIIGKVILAIPFIGYILTYFRNHLILFIFLIVSLVLIYDKIPKK